MSHIVGLDRAVGVNRTRFSVSGLLIKYRTIVILLLFVLVFTLLNKVFLNPINLLNMLKRMSFVAVTAFSMTFVITMGGLDLSVGSIRGHRGGLSRLASGARGPSPARGSNLPGRRRRPGRFEWPDYREGKDRTVSRHLATMYIYNGIALVLSEGKPIPIMAQRFTNLRKRPPVRRHPDPDFDHDRILRRHLVSLQEDQVRFLRTMHRRQPGSGEGGWH